MPSRRSVPAYVWVVIALLGSGALAIGALCVGAFVFRGGGRGASPAAREPFRYAMHPLPAFPERGPAVAVEPGVAVHQIDLVPDADGGALWLYLPEGQHAERSLACVLIAPAGSPMVLGSSLGEDSRPEHVPYVRAGMAVVAYELDGAVADGRLAVDPMTAAAFGRFRSACAGLVNARFALEFVLARAPEVDPARVYAAGHSSAGTLALLLAAHETRLAGCAAYAPCCDVVGHLTPETIAGLAPALRGLEDFAVQASPVTHVERIGCPVFLFHAQDDSVVPIAESQAFAERLRDADKDVTLATVASGDHYDAMIAEGIPRGIEWIQAR